MELELELEQRARLGLRIRFGGNRFWIAAIVRFVNFWASLMMDQIVIGKTEKMKKIL